ncbi:MAG: hypothetical protein IJZ36_05000 [Bacilli bacterium]|nr:hypothetical protein [Bacilli bacterium]
MGKTEDLIDESICIYDEEIEKEPINSSVEVETVEDEELGTFTEESEPKISSSTEIIEQVDEDFGDADIGSMETEAREEAERQKQQAIDDEIEIRATEQATTIVTEKIRAATEVLNEQNRLATRQAEQEIAERQLRLEKKIKKNKRKEMFNKVKGVVYTALVFFLLYLFYTNPTLNNGVRTVVSNTLGMFSDLVAGEDVDSNEVVNSIGNALNNQNMKYVTVTVDEDGNVIETTESTERIDE